MEIIRNYLETMFHNLPNTEEVQKAKRELWQMMEDKYAELKSEGKAENEAVGTVIAEFGNLDEIADDLGIGKVVSDIEPEEKRAVTMQEAMDFIGYKTKWGFLVGLGVLLCIVSPCGAVMGYDIAGIAFLFAAVAVAVGIFIASSVMNRWEFLKNEPCIIDFDTARYVHHERESYRGMHAILNAVGVILCIVSVTPVIMFDGDEEMGTVAMFVLVGIGVLLFVATGMRNGAYRTLLKLSVGTGFTPQNEEQVCYKKQVYYKNRTLAAIMSVYWPTVTCIYLCWSFLSFDWDITWIVWVIAAVAAQIIKSLNRED